MTTQESEARVADRRATHPRNRTTDPRTPALRKRLEAIGAKTAEAANLAAEHFAACTALAEKEREEMAAEAADLGDQLTRRLNAPHAVLDVEDSVLRQMEVVVDSFERDLRLHVDACHGGSSESE